MLNALDGDRYRWNGFTRAGDLFFAVTLGLYPNRRVMNAAVSVLRGGLQYVVRGSRSAPDEPTDLRAGPISIEVLEPLRSVRLSIAPNPHEIAGELVFRARTEPPEEPLHPQFGTWDGWLAVGAERIKLDASHVLGTHDRYFGTDSVFERETTSGPTPAPQVSWLWAPVHFADLCTHFQIAEDAAGHTSSSYGAIVPLLSTGGPPEVMASVHHSVQWETGTRRALSATLTLVPLEGEPHQLELEPLLTFSMRGVGYGDPESGDDMKQGEDATSGELIRPAEIDPMEPRHLHVQQLCRVRMGARVGYGALEQLVIGAQAFAFE